MFAVSMPRPPLTPVVPPFCIVGTDAVNNSLF